jgi:hypothetical protein
MTAANPAPRPNPRERAVQAALDAVRKFALIESFELHPALRPLVRDKGIGGMIMLYFDLKALGFEPEAAIIAEGLRRYPVAPG